MLRGVGRRCYSYDIGQDILKSDEYSKIITANAETVKKTLLNLYVHLVCHSSYRYADKLKESINQFITEWDIEEKDYPLSF